MFFIKLREVRKKSAETRIYLHEKGYAIMKNRTVEIIYLRPFSAPRGRGSDGT